MTIFFRLGQTIFIFLSFDLLKPSFQPTLYKFIVLDFLGLCSFILQAKNSNLVLTVEYGCFFHFKDFLNREEGWVFVWGQIRGDDWVALYWLFLGRPICVRVRLYVIESKVMKLQGHFCRLIFKKFANSLSLSSVLKQHFGFFNTPNANALGTIMTPILIVRDSKHCNFLILMQTNLDGSYSLSIFFSND